MNVVVFASDAKGLSSLNSTINEISERGINLFAMICQDTQLRFPIQQRDMYHILTNCDDSNPIYSESLGVNLPFKPDWLIINRERWSPETEIIIEFKQKFGSKIALIEPNAAMINGVEGFLESHSKNKFVPYIDVFFDHSDFIMNQRKLMGFKGNSVVVGNPKYDLNLDIDTDSINQLKSYYGVDDTKTQVLLFSLVNSSRNVLFKEFEKYINEHNEYQFFIKPYPGEPFDPQFSYQYHPNFFIDGVTPILEETHIWGMFHICDIHIGAFSSIFHPSFLLNKKVIDLSDKIGMRDKMLDTSPILSSNGIGMEDKADLWMRTFGFKSINELSEFISDDRIKYISKNNDVVWNIVDKFVYLKDTNYDSILKLFDTFNDNKSCNRIVNYLENE